MFSLYGNVGRIQTRMIGKRVNIYQTVLDLVTDMLATATRVIWIDETALVLYKRF